jgi:hypothetical protein
VLTERVFIERAAMFGIHKFYVLPIYCIYVFTAITFPFNMNVLVSITKTERVYCTVRAVYVTWVNLTSRVARAVLAVRSDKAAVLQISHILVGQTFWARTHRQEIHVQFSRNVFGKRLIGMRFCFCLWRCGPTRARAFSFMRFPDHTQRHTILGRTPLDEWSARRRDLYLTTNNTHKRHTFMPPAGFEPTISAGARPQTYALDRAATGTDIFEY